MTIIRDNKEFKLTEGELCAAFIEYQHNCDMLDVRQFFCTDKVALTNDQIDEIVEVYRNNVNRYVDHNTGIYVELANVAKDYVMKENDRA